ncbi:MAG: hypothetical protein K0S23_92 [Fluviicola sp.]|jgi:hypothetical protein|uniref:hypothetical protein n=1 Tax=Fluviicola sp. TaxID=1917219 RepID=UPI0026223ADE|nr:hypothetical protein [Fluviicola sp.]MDF3025785.1 hypothetical protein [Fluviicola sp.]
MIRAVLILICGLLVSCRTPEKVSQEQTNTQTEAETPKTIRHSDDAYYLGEVQILDCGPVIQVSHGKNKYSYTPANLDPKFQVDKLRLKLIFKVLDERGTGCSEFRAIEIKEVTEIR